jgi:mRNA interferase HigB
MRVINCELLADFLAAHPDAHTPLDAWLQATKEAQWKHLMEVRKTWSRSTDYVEGKVVFNIGGNKYRLVTKINYTRQIVRIHHVLTHEEYDKDKWKIDKN